MGINDVIIEYMKRRLSILTIMIVCSLAALGQSDRRVQNKPYVDLRPLHFGILVGLNMQDIEFENVGPQTITYEDGSVHDELIVCDADKWNPGFSVGVLAEWRLSDHFSLRFTPQMHFGAKHLTFLNMKQLDAEGRPFSQTQDLKNTYVSLPIDLKFAAPRWNNHRPYIKLIPELKFCFGLTNVLDTNHKNELRDDNLKAYAGSVSKAQSKMIVLTFYFE